MKSAAATPQERRPARVRSPAGAAAEVVSRQVPALVWTTDAELRITSAAGAGLERAGLARGAFEGRTLAEIVGPDGDARAVIDAHERALDGETVEVQLALLDRDWSVEAQPLR